MKEFMKSCLSLNEYRISALIIGYFITLLTTMYQYIQTGIVDQNVQNILLTFIYIVGGIQVSNHIKEYAMTKSSNEAMRIEERDPSDK
ncbi:hypothetical protein [Halobacillus mangrovi]|uniref:hypothetical protein n=1 Tax=Halobacillus mangrovi TaxID=402384 RepID=UPI003D9961C0